MNAELIIFSILLIVGLLIILVWLASELAKQKEQKEQIIDTAKANEETLQKHLRQIQQQERLKNLSLDELRANTAKLYRDKENN